MVTMKNTFVFVPVVDENMQQLNSNFVHVLSKSVFFLADVNSIQPTGYIIKLLSKSHMSYMLHALWCVKA